ncbi:unnamed protein product [Lota lota]
MPQMPMSAVSSHCCRPPAPMIRSQAQYYSYLSPRQSRQTAPGGSGSPDMTSRWAIVVLFPSEGPRRPRHVRLVF